MKLFKNVILPLILVSILIQFYASNQVAQRELDSEFARMTYILTKATYTMHNATQELDDAERIIKMLQYENQKITKSCQTKSNILN